jgi:lysophospholipase L1-like esterase
MNRFWQNSSRKQGFTFWSLLLTSLTLIYFCPSSFFLGAGQPHSSEGKQPAKDEVQAKLENYFLSRKYQPWSAGWQLKIKKDNSGRLWLLETGGLKLSHLCCLDSPTTAILNALNNLISGSQVHSINFTFDSANEPWLVWVESGAEDQLKLASPYFGQSLTIAAGPPYSLTSPTICVDWRNQAHIIWVKSVKGVDRLFYCRFSGLDLSQPEILFPGNLFPSLLPEAQIDFLGRLWLAWSAYDGEDYEIFVACFNGTSWSAPQKITSNSRADLLAAWTPQSEGGLFLSWLESGTEPDQIWGSRLNGNNLERPKLLWSDSLLSPEFNLISGDNGLLLCWRKDNKFVILPLPAEGGWKKKGLEPKEDDLSPAPFLPSNRNDDNYIAFGDSITSGLIKTSLDPELYYYNGYPARLEQRLKQEYGAGRVFNEGRDGELTSQGLSRIADVLTEYDARYLLLMEGFNDVVFLNISLDTIIFNLQEMVRRCLQAGVMPFLATITPRRDSIWYQPIYRDRHLNLNQRIRQLAPALKVPLVDQNLALENYPPSDGGLLSLLSVDLKHPNEKGYQVIAETWFKEIQAFPFPPRNLKVVRRDFIWDNKFLPLFMAPLTEQANPADQGLGNFLTWEANPKIKNTQLFAGYRIYRKKAAESDSAYALIATTKEKLNYFDKHIILSISYAYLVSSYRTDGVEGPAAGPVIR